MCVKNTFIEPADTALYDLMKTGMAAVLGNTLLFKAYLKKADDNGGIESAEDIIADDLLSLSKAILRKIREDGD